VVRHLLSLLRVTRTARRRGPVAEPGAGGRDTADSPIMRSARSRSGVTPNTAGAQSNWTNWS
jgi:hypothetical protein